MSTFMIGKHNLNYQNMQDYDYDIRVNRYKITKRNWKQ